MAFLFFLFFQPTSIFGDPDIEMKKKKKNSDFEAMAASSVIEGDGGEDLGISGPMG